MLADELWKQVASTSDQTSRKHQPLCRLPFSFEKVRKGPREMRLYIFHCLDKKLVTDSVCDRECLSIFLNRGLFKKNKGNKKVEKRSACPNGVTDGRC